MVLRCYYTIREWKSKGGILMQIKIAVTGKMRSGKSTVVQLLQEELIKINEKIEVNEVGFGDMLKYFAHDIFLVKDLANKPRTLYQEFGQKMREVSQLVNGHENVWIDLLDYYLEESFWNKYDNASEGDLSSGSDENILCALITDLRQPNEYEWCRNNGYIIIKVQSDDENRLERIISEGDSFTEENLNHETELYIDNFEADYVIDNNQTVENLKNLVEIIALSIYGKAVDEEYKVK